MNPELKPTKIAATIAATFLMSTMAPTHANGDFLRAVITSGSGRFSKCWNLLFYNYCATHHVHLPEHISTGDALKLDYGSNPKHYIFHVSRIRRTGGNCTVRTGGATVKGEKIKINNCRAASTSGESNRPRRRGRHILLTRNDHNSQTQPGVKIVTLFRTEL